MASLIEQGGNIHAELGHNNLCDDHGSKLCRECTILWRDEISRITRSSFGPYGPLRVSGVYVGNLEHIHRDSACPLCQFFHSMRFEDSDSGDYHLMAWLPLQLTSPAPQYLKTFEPPGSFLLGVTAGKNEDMSGEQAVYDSKNAGLIAMGSEELRNGTFTRWLDHPIFPMKPFKARIVDKHRLDYPFAREFWKSRQSLSKLNYFR
jgi:hypothetical protein